MAKRRKSQQKSYIREASSFILIALGVILILAILSYDRADDPNLRIENNSIQLVNKFTPWKCWDARNTFEYKNFPGIYTIAKSNNNLNDTLGPIL